MIACQGDSNIHVQMHIGPIMAGVLHGECACFQLFGNSMKMASWMESNRTAGCIQVLAKTVQSLIGAGKAHWITPCHEKIGAKGKGESQMYWVQIYIALIPPGCSGVGAMTKLIGYDQTDRLWPNWSATGYGRLLFFHTVATQLWVYCSTSRIIALISIIRTRTPSKSGDRTFYCCYSHRIFWSIVFLWHFHVFNLDNDKITSPLLSN